MFQYAPTNKLLYAKDIPKFKQEVKAYYKQVREQPPITASEFKGFLQEESKVMSISLQNLGRRGTVRGGGDLMSVCFRSRNMKTSSTTPRPSKKSTNSSSDTLQRSVISMSTLTLADLFLLATWSWRARFKWSLKPRLCLMVMLP